jgi:hypothetical protein
MLQHFPNIFSYFCQHFTKFCNSFGNFETGGVAVCWPTTEADEGEVEAAMAGARGW